MDTSDSEYFESADEDFHSEDDVIERVEVEGKKLKKLSLGSESVGKIEKCESQNKVDEIISKKPEQSGNYHLKNKNEVGSEDLKNDESFGKDEKCKLASKGNDNDDEEISKKPEQSSNFWPGKKIEKVQELHSKSNERIEECDKEKNEFLKKPIESGIQLEKLGSKHDDEDMKCDLGTKTIEITNKTTNLFKPETVQHVDIKNKQLHVENKERETPNKPLEVKETNDGWDIDNDENLWDEDETNWPDADKNEENPNDNMWENDEWENIEETTQNNESEDQKSWGTWGAWSLLSTATQTISNQVSQGLTNVLETGMGIPSAEELAKQHLKEEKEFQNENSKESSTAGGFIFGNLASGIKEFVETTSTKVISGGLDTLETIGKKTMEVLQEGDPGLKKKRALLKLEPDKPILSQVLREAKENAEKQLNIDDNLQIKQQVIRKPNYETLFDDHHGLVHLEALEMLSKQCEIKLKTLLESCTPEAALDMQETMDQVKELCELPEEDEDDQQSFDQIKEKISSAIEEINISISYKRLMQTWEEIEEWLNKVKLNICDENELHLQAIKSLAQITALAVEQFHKTGELLLIKEHRSTADEADSLVQLTTALTALIGNAAAKFSDKLNAKLTGGFSNDREHINGLITNVFYEAGNSSSYIQDAFQLLVPVLQVGAV